VRLSGSAILGTLALGIFVSLMACVIAVVLVRRMRRNFTEDAFPLEDETSLSEFPLRTYSAVIQDLKQQKHELLSAQQEERRRAKALENVSAAVLANLLSGVLFLNSNGSIRNANAAARNILGFASPVGMGGAEVFRNATVIGSPGESLAAAVQASVRAQTPRNMQAEYVTPTGEPRRLEVTVTSVRSGSGELMGGACLITDKTEMAMMQKQEELRGEISAEMALELRASLATISDYAQQLAASRDPESARQIAADIAYETAQLNHTIGGFLAGARVAKAAGA
jgi:nitrogen fixation/metabolism regulation signal transduction histidine kinase